MIKQFTELEVKNQNYLSGRGVQFEIVCLTANILKHCIFDAKMSMRVFLRENHVHDFFSQANGQESKCMVKTHILTFMRDIPTETSLYRAGARGDCRMWFGSAILPVTEADDVYLVTTIDKEFYIVNITKIDIETCCQTSFPSPVQRWMKEVSNKIKDSN